MHIHLIQKGEIIAIPMPMGLRRQLSLIRHVELDGISRCDR